MDICGAKPLAFLCKAKDWGGEKIIGNLGRASLQKDEKCMTNTYGNFKVSFGLDYIYCLVKEWKYYVTVTEVAHLMEMCPFTLRKSRAGKSISRIVFIEVEGTHILILSKNIYTNLESIFC